MLPGSKRRRSIRSLDCSLSCCSSDNENEPRQPPRKLNNRRRSSVVNDGEKFNIISPRRSPRKRVSSSESASTTDLSSSLLAPIENQVKRRSPRASVKAVEDVLAQIEANPAPRNIINNFSVIAPSVNTNANPKRGRGRPRRSHSSPQQHQQTPSMLNNNNIIAMPCAPIPTTAETPVSPPAIRSPRTRRTDNNHSSLDCSVSDSDSVFSPPQCATRSQQMSILTFVTKSPVDCSSGNGCSNMDSAISHLSETAINGQDATATSSTVTNIDTSGDLFDDLPELEPIPLDNDCRSSSKVQPDVVVPSVHPVSDSRVTDLLSDGASKLFAEENSVIDEKSIDYQQQQPETDVKPHAECGEMQQGQSDAQPTGEPSTSMIKTEDADGILEPVRLAWECDWLAPGQLVWAKAHKKWPLWPCMIRDKSLATQDEKAALLKQGFEMDTTRFFIFLPFGSCGCTDVSNLQAYLSADQHQKKATAAACQLADKLLTVEDLGCRQRQLVKTGRMLEFIDDLQAYHEARERERLEKEQERKEKMAQRRLSKRQSLSVSVLAMKEEIMSDSEKDDSQEQDECIVAVTKEDDDDGNNTYIEEDKLRGGLAYLYSSKPTCFEEKWFIDVGNEGEDIVRCIGGCNRTFGLDRVRELTANSDHLHGLTQVNDKWLFTCTQCRLGSEGGNPCIICHQPSSSSSTTHKCTQPLCPFFLHVDCLKSWRFARDSDEVPPKTVDVENITCPAHECRTCVLSNVKADPEFLSQHRVSCIECPTMYHFNVECLPATAAILNQSNIICGKHFNKKETGGSNKKSTSKNVVHVDICQSCSVGNGETLVCCEYCPMAYHLPCVDLSQQPDSEWLCQACATGHEPKYNSLVWAKYGNTRWWPSLIVHPEKLPSNVEAMKHSPGEIPVRFLGTCEYGWIPSTRVYALLDEDQLVNNKKSSNNKNEQKYYDGLLEAVDLREQFRQKRLAGNLKRNVVESNSLPVYNHIDQNVYRTGERARVDNDESDNAGLCDCDAPEYSSDEGEDDHDDLQDNEQSDVEDDDDGPIRRLPSACDSGNCSNYGDQIECPPNCMAGGACKNQRFRQREYAQVIPFKTASRGWGLQSLRSIPAETFVIEYVGEVIDVGEMRRRIRAQNERGDVNFYILELSKTLFIDAGPAGNLARFMNHSCDPNCRPYVWRVGRHLRVGLFTIKPVKAGEELTFDYRLDCRGIDVESKMRCQCGSSKCVGLIDAETRTEQLLKITKDSLPAAPVFSKKKKSKYSSVLKSDRKSSSVCGSGNVTREEEFGGDDLMPLLYQGSVTFQ